MNLDHFKAFHVLESAYSPSLRALVEVIEEQESDCTCFEEVDEEEEGGETLTMN